MYPFTSTLQVQSLHPVGRVRFKILYPENYFFVAPQVREIHRRWFPVLLVPITAFLTGVCALILLSFQWDNRVFRKAALLQKHPGIARFKILYVPWELSQRFLVAVAAWRLEEQQQGTAGTARGAGEINRSDRLRPIAAA